MHSRRPRQAPSRPLRICLPISSTMRRARLPTPLSSVCPTSPSQGHLHKKYIQAFSVFHRGFTRVENCRWQDSTSMCLCIINVRCFPRIHGPLGRQNVVKWGETFGRGLLFIGQTFQVLLQCNRVIESKTQASNGESNAQLWLIHKVGFFFWQYGVVIIICLRPLKLKKKQILHFVNISQIQLVSRLLLVFVRYAHNYY